MTVQNQKIEEDESKEFRIKLDPAVKTKTLCSSIRFFCHKILNENPYMTIKDFFDDISIQDLELLMVMCKSANRGDLGAERTHNDIVNMTVLVGVFGILEDEPMLNNNVISERIMSLETLFEIEYGHRKAYFPIGTKVNRDNYSLVNLENVLLEFPNKDLDQPSEKV